VCVRACVCVRVRVRVNLRPTDEIMESTKLRNRRHQIAAPQTTSSEVILATNTVENLWISPRYVRSRPECRQRALTRKD